MNRELPENGGSSVTVGSRGDARGRAADEVDLSVIVPCYQEADRIRGTVDTIAGATTARFGSAWEIIVVDDGSRDDTADRARDIGPRVRVHRLPENRGKGAAVREGMLAARGRLRLMTDADLSTPIDEVDCLMAAIGRGADIAIGRRTGPYSRVVTRQPLYRQTMGRTFNLIGRLLFDLRYQDTQCGFKLFTSRAAEAIFSRTRVNRFAFDFECVLLARELGFRIEECYVLWEHREGSRVRLFRDSFSMLTSLAGLWLSRR